MRKEGKCCGHSAEVAIALGQGGISNTIHRENTFSTTGYPWLKGDLKLAFGLGSKQNQFWKLYLKILEE